MPSPPQNEASASGMPFTEPSSASGSGGRVPAREALVTLALFTGVIILLFSPGILTGKVFFQGDIHRIHYPFQWAIAEAVRAGRWPLWTTQVFSGYPLIAECQTGLYYPLHALFYLPFLSMHTALNLTVAAHFVLGGWFAYLLARRLRLDPWPARTAGFAFMLSGWMLVRVIHLNVHQASVWIPAVLYCLESAALAAAAPGGGWRSWRYLVLAGLALGIQALVFFPPLSFYTGLAVALYGAFWARREAGQESPAPAALRAVGRLACVGGLGLALGMAQIAPTLELLGQTPRKEAHSYEYVTNLSLPPWHLLTWLFPNAFGSPATGDYWGAQNYWELCSYVGVLALALAGVGAIRSRDPRRWYYVALAAFSVFMALGRYNPLYRLVPYVPGFNMWQGPGRYLILSTVALAVLAGYGAQALAGCERWQVRFRRGSLAVAAVALVGAAAMWLLAAPVRSLAFSVLQRRMGGGDWQRPPEYSAAQFAGFWPDYYGHRLADVLWLAAFAAAVVFLLRRTGRTRSAAWLPPALCALVAAELFRVGYGYTPMIARSFYDNPPQLASRPIADQHSGMSPGRVWRVADRPWELEQRAGRAGWVDGGRADTAVRESLPWNMSLFWGFRLLDGGTSLQPQPFAEYLTPASEALEQGTDTSAARQALRMLGGFNVEYLAAPIDLAQAGAVPLQSAGMTLYRNPWVLPRAYLAARVQAVPDSPAAAAAVTGPHWDPRSDAVVTGSPPALSGAAIGADETVTVADRGENELRLQVRANAPRWLVVTDRDYPGWEARLDGRRVPIYRTNLFMRGLPVPAGDHTVEMVYRPRSVWLGLGVSLAALAGILGFLALTRGRIAGDA